MADTRRPVEDDIRVDDQEYNPALEPKSALAWLNLLQESEDAFKDWNDHCDKIDRQYANLERLANMSREKEFQLFWANAEVIKPAIFARPPIPVVVPKFNDRRPVYQAACELLERCAAVAFDLTHIFEVMRQVRDDLALIGRGVPWCRYEEAGRGRKGPSGYGDADFERVCIDFKHRRDFLHSISRCWYEVTWVAAASYLTRDEARARFYPYSGTAYQEAEYRVDKDSAEVGGADARERAKFWEIWHKSEGRVVWVAQGVEDILDEAAPHLKLQDFFPCPCPAYGVMQRGSLIPVPDVMQYRDQLEEVNLLTGRIHALSDSLEAKGFYPSGGAEISEAVQAAVKSKSPGRILVPIADWAAFGGSKEVIVWIPIDMIAQVINTLVTLRKQVIEDVYQIMGLSDIMRGSTDARETLGAQEMKSQYGTSRIKDKQMEMTRVARDLVVICSDIMLSKFSDETLVYMSQTQLPTREMQRAAVGRIQQQMQQVQQQALMAPSQQQPQQPGQSGSSPQAQAAKQMQQQLRSMQDAIRQITEKPNIEQVLTFLRDNRARAFVLDIETDSTILVDEKQTKEAHSEFLGMLSRLLPQLSQMITTVPETTEFCGEMLKFAVSPFRAGRTMDSSIDELIEKMKGRADQPRGEDPTTATNRTALQIEQIKQSRQKEKDDADTQLKAAELQMKDRHEQAKIASAEKIKLAELLAKQQDAGQKAQVTNQKAMHDREAHQADMIKMAADMQLNQQKAGMAAAAAQAKQADMSARGEERRAAQEFKQSQPPQRPV